MINTQAIAKTATQTIVRSFGTAKTLIFSWANQIKKVLLGSGITAMVASLRLIVSHALLCNYLHFLVLRTDKEDR